jgi:hypothetical protein
MIPSTYYQKGCIVNGVDSHLLDLAKNIIDKLRAEGWQAIINNAYRTAAQAAANATKGVGILHSKHCEGLAVDIIDQRYGWDGPLKNIEEFRLAYSAQVSNYKELTWGGHWTKYGALGDWAHIELNDRSKAVITDDTNQLSDIKLSSDNITD